MNTGDKLQVQIEIVKLKNGIPTVVIINGKTYILQHKNQYK